MGDASKARERKIDIRELNGVKVEYQDDNGNWTEEVPEKYKNYWSSRFPKNYSLQIGLKSKADANQVAGLFEYAAMENPVDKEFWDELAAATRNQINAWKE